MTDLEGARWVERRPPPPLGYAHRAGDLWVGAAPRDDGIIKEVMALDAESYAARWRYRVEGPATSLRWAARCPEVLVIQLQSNELTRIIAFEPRSGRELWREDGHAYGALIAAGVLVTDQAGKLLGRRALDGSALWSRDVISYELAASGRWLVTGNEEGIDVLDPESGETRWRLPIKAPNHQASFAIEGDTLYISRWGEGGIRMIAAELATGEVAWTSQALDTPAAIDSPAVGREHVFGCTTTGVVIGWDKRTGARWFTRGAIGCADFAVRAGPPEEISLNAAHDGPILQFRPAYNLDAVRPVPIEGIVMDDEGRPAAFAEVAVGITRVESDARGQYRAEVNFPGTVCAIAHKGEYAARQTCEEPSAGRATRLDLYLVHRPGDHAP